MLPSRISDIDLPVLIRKPKFPRLSPFPVQISPPHLGQPTKPLQPPVHGVVHPPPPLVRNVTGVDALVRHVPVTVVIPVTEPRLPPQVMYGVEFWWVRPEQLVLHAGLVCRIRPEILQEIDPPRQAVPPHKDLVEVALVAAVVRNDVFAVVHEEIERAVGWLDDHDAGVEEVHVVAGGRHLGEVEEEVEVAEDDDVGVDEDDFVVFGELPEAELAVVVFVVGAVFGSRVSDPLDEPELPASSGESGAFGNGDRVV